MVGSVDRELPRDGSDFRSGAMRNRRVVVLLLGMFVAVVLVLVQPVHAWLLSIFEVADAVVRNHPVWGMLVFVLLAALSAMLAFVSSSVLVPAAIYAWGPAVCFLLLWAGWFLGGLGGYAVGRYVGRGVVEKLVQPGALARYDRWARSSKSLVLILMVQLALPSDLASYLFGMVRCRFVVFAIALATAEVPYALGSVYLGTSFLQRRVASMLAIGVAAVLVSLWAVHRIQRHVDTGASPIAPRPFKALSGSM